MSAVEKAGADWIHVDVMDGHFVPNLTMGPVVVRALKKVTSLPLDCHLMVTDPGAWIEPFAKAGAAIITVHIETAQDPTTLLKSIRALGCKAGLSLNPDTPIEKLDRWLNLCDLVLLMSVFPGFSGQTFIESTWDRLRALEQRKREHGFQIEVDGGVFAGNASQLIEFGADVLVAGNAVFGEKNRKEAIRKLRP